MYTIQIQNEANLAQEHERHKKMSRRIGICMYDKHDYNEAKNYKKIQNLIFYLLFGRKKRKCLVSLLITIGLCMGCNNAHSLTYSHMQSIKSNNGIVYAL